MSRRMPFHRIAAIVVLILAALWVLTGKMSSVGSDQVQAAQPAPKAEAAPKAATLTTVAAMMPVFADHARVIRISGETDADKSVVLASRASGIISGLNVVKGQRVAAGDALVTLEGPDLQAAVANAKMLLEQRTRELDVDLKLQASGNMAELTMIAAKSAKAAAAAAVAQAQAELDKLTLRAPFAGIVDDVAVQKGQWATPGMPVATLISIDPIVVRAEVGELDVSDLAKGAKAHVDLVDGTSMDGTVRYVSKVASKVTRTYPVEVALANAGGKIPVGMTAQITLYAPPVRSITVPRSVITLSDAGDLGLRTVDDQNVTHFAKVTLVDDTPSGLVVAGVPEGVRIVVAGQDLVKDGQKVDVVAPPVAPAETVGTNP
ncbi:MAG: efflux RND transporter periplasmic adaptor subunit [Paracoccaceae bacterium]|nr:efflux RND transporter periplasmic adaptor subunit [Paracoccaceae bacterium]